ncbi:hypothetical protein AS593_17215 [Caulobacter vibrioides]|nr:hypothetical protein AS593_17215 [Caulobacter vibrioides]
MSGWALIGREPASVAVWSAVFLLGLFLPSVLLCLPLAGDFSRLFQVISASTDPESPEVLSQIMALQSRMALIGLGSMALNVVVPTVVVAAVLRAVLRPGERRGFYLRIGAAEGWMMLVLLVFMFGLYFATFATFLPALLAGGVGYAAMAMGGDKDAGAMVGVAMGVVAWIGSCGALLWALLRLSMAMPMTFAEGRFLLFESWELTRGHALRLFGMMLLAGLTIFIFQLALMLIAIGVAILVGPGMAEQLKGARSATEIMAVLWPVAAVGVPAAAVIHTMLTAVAAAPLACAYRGLSDASQARTAA